MPNTILQSRAIVRLSPIDALESVRDFLQGLVTQDMALVQPGAPQWAGLLSAQGKALFDFFLWADGDDVLIDCEAQAADDLVRRLSLYRLRRKVAIARDEEQAVHWALDRVDEPLDPRHPDMGHRWLAAKTDDQPADAAYLSYRLSLGITEGLAELGSDKTLWLECNAAELNGVAFNKGCYVGQENTARMNWRQKVNRRMTVVPLSQSDAKRQRIAYLELGLSVEHWRVEDMTSLSLPPWQVAAIASPVTQNES